MYQMLNGTNSISLLLNANADDKHWITIVASDNCAYHSYMCASEALEIVKGWNERKISCVFVKITDSEYL